MEERNGQTELTESDRHRLLASRERRLVLELLADGSYPVDLDELSTAVAERASDGHPPGGPSDDSLKVGLHHCHLPMLSDAGVLDYDPNARRVETGGRCIDELW